MEIPEIFRRSTPDLIFLPNSITFVYDHHDDYLYHAEYPNYHRILLNSPWGKSGSSVADLLNLPGAFPDREEAIAEGYPTGRFGEKKLGSQTYKAIAFWNEEFDDFDKCLRAIIREFPYMADENTILYSDKSKGFEPFLLKDTNIELNVQNKVQNKVQVNPDCQKLTFIDIDGIPMSLESILSSLHMVKGSKLARIKSAFCQKAPDLKNKLIKAGCVQQAKLIDNVLQRFKETGMQCPGDSKEWDQLKSAGRFEFRQGLKDMFRKGDLDHMNQKDIDSAWDELVHGKREHAIPSFKEWLMRRMS